MILFVVLNMVCIALKYKESVFFWNFYTTQQIIGHIPLLGLQMTPNVYCLFSDISWVLRYAYIPILPVTRQHARPDDSGVSPVFTDFGYESTQIIINA